MKHFSGEGREIECGNTIANKHDSAEEKKKRITCNGFFFVRRKVEIAV